MLPSGLSRIDKLFVDRDQTDPNIVRVRRTEFGVSICCGPDTAGSYTLQLAALTAARLASRCFPGAVRVVLDAELHASRLRLWPALNLKLGDALAAVLGPDAVVREHDPSRRAIVLGNAPALPKALRLTFDGWIAQVGPAEWIERLREREYCPLAGVLGASLAISELFLSFAAISIEAGRRTVALSLWEPGTDIADAAALGVPVEFLPKSLWVLGLGHLGNAYLWSLGTLPYADAAQVTFHLNDYDTVEPENVETCVLFGAADVGSLKTRVCDAWLARHGYRTRLMERAFDASFRCRGAKPAAEPRLALCGFDSIPARRDLATAEFDRVVDSGLGSTSSNFDTLGLHTLPNSRPAMELWPDLSAEEIEKRHREQDRIARENPGYLALPHDECGRYELAGKSIGVPFVGSVAASFVVAEVLRLLHGGTACTDLKMSLGTPVNLHIRSQGVYTASDLTAIEYATTAWRSDAES
jgi:hypothetical protein